MQISKNMLTGFIPAALSIVIWGTTFVSTKLLLTEFSPLEILIVRFFIGYITLCILSPRPLHFLGTRLELLFAGAGLCGCTMYQLLENQALVYTQASNVSIVVSSAPLFTALLAGLFLRSSGEKLTIRFFFGFLVAITGIVLVSLNGVALHISPVGDILAVICALFWAGYSVFTGKINTLHFSVIQTTRRIYFYALISLIPFCATDSVNFSPEVNLTRFSNPTVILNYIYLGTGASAICFALWSKALKTLGVVKTTAAIYAIPAVTMIFAAILLNEKMTPLIIFGAILIVAGLILSQKKHVTGAGYHPDEVIFSVTAQCNLHCPHCFVSRTATSELSEQDALTFLDSCAQNNISKVGFTGGEPLLRPDFVCTICQKAIDYDMTFDRLMTNGVFTSDDVTMYKTLQRVYDAGFDGKIGLSYDIFHGQHPEQIIKFITAVFTTWQCRDCIEILSVIPTKETREQKEKFLHDLQQIANALGGTVIDTSNRKNGHGVIFITETHTSSAEETLSIPIIRFAQSCTAKSNAHAATTEKTWFTDDFCRDTGNVLYVHTDGNIAPCCGFANENTALRIGTVHNTVSEIIEQAQQNVMVQRCFTSGLATYRTELERTGRKLPPPTDDICSFCGWLCTQTESDNPSISVKM